MVTHRRRRVSGLAGPGGQWADRADEDTKAAIERIGALLEAGRLDWITRAQALASGRVDCERGGGSLDGLGWRRRGLSAPLCGS